MLDRLDIVQARPDGIDVHEDLILAKVIDQAVIEAAGVAGAVAAPVADEDSRHRPSLWAKSPSSSIAHVSEKPISL